MMQKNSKGIYQSSLLTELGVLHGYSSRHFGDLRDSESREKFLEMLGVTGGGVVVGEQVHGIHIARVAENDKGKVLPGIDGLVYTKLALQGETLQGLGVTFADCVPILAVDQDAKIIGTAHAGWKGTLHGIARELINEMKAVGAQVNNIYISIGPHIGMCCYNVGEDRVLAFQKQFGRKEKIAARISGEWHLDIGYANYQLLLEAGIQKDHIDAPPVCTSCQVAEFNSFRKDPKDRFGVQMGVISL